MRTIQEAVLIGGPLDGEVQKLEHPRMSGIWSVDKSTAIVHRYDRNDDRVIDGRIVFVHSKATKANQCGNKLNPQTKP